MGYAEQYPEFYADWVAKQGIEHALKDALQAAKVIEASPMDYVNYVRRVTATGLGILENVINHG